MSIFLSDWITMFFDEITFIGLDAIERVLKRAKTVGMKDFGQG